RFVEDEDAAAAMERLGDRHELTFRDTERSNRRPRVGRKLELSEHGLRLSAHARTIDHGEGTEAPDREVPKGDVFRNRERRHEAQFLRDGHDTGGGRLARARKGAFLAVD